MFGSISGTISGTIVNEAKVVNNVVVVNVVRSRQDHARTVIVGDTAGYETGSSVLRRVRMAVTGADCAETGRVEIPDREFGLLRRAPIARSEREAGCGVRAFKCLFVRRIECWDNRRTRRSVAAHLPRLTCTVARGRIRRRSTDLYPGRDGCIGVVRSCLRQSELGTS